MMFVDDRLGTHVKLETIIPTVANCIRFMYPYCVCVWEGGSTVSKGSREIAE